MLKFTPHIREVPLPGFAFRDKPSLSSPISRGWKGEGFTGVFLLLHRRGQTEAWWRCWKRKLCDRPSRVWTDWGIDACVRERRTHATKCVRNHQNKTSFLLCISRGNYRDLSLPRWHWSSLPRLSQHPKTRGKPGHILRQSLWHEPQLEKGPQAPEGTILDPPRWGPGLG